MAVQVQVKVFDCLAENLERAIREWLCSLRRQVEIVSSSTSYSGDGEVVHTIYYNGG